MLGSPGVVLDGAQGQTEGQVAAGLLGRAHQPLQVGLRGAEVLLGLIPLLAGAQPSARQQQPQTLLPTPPPPPPWPQDPGWEALVVCRLQPRPGVVSRLNCEPLGQGQVQMCGAPSPGLARFPSEG